MEPTSAALPEGSPILQYRVSRVLGVGGFGITYLAVDSTLQMEVAIKEYFPREMVYRREDGVVAEKLNLEVNEFQTSKEAFINEARRIARFRSPGIVRVFNFFEANGTAYMVMEYEEGESLTALLRRHGRLPEPELIEIAARVIDAMEVMHREGYIHRDLKPDNIVIRRDGTPVLLDFGSTREFSAHTTGAMTALVTPGFAPLEQYFEERSRQGPWTDIYSLAAILHLAVTGAMPAQAPSRSAAIVNGLPDPLTRTAESCAGRYRQGLLRAIDWGLEMREADRPQSLEAFRGTLLGEAAGGGARPAAPPPAAPPTPNAAPPTMAPPTMAPPTMVPTTSPGALLTTMRLQAAAGAPATPPAPTQRPPLPGAGEETRRVAPEVAEATRRAPLVGGGEEMPTVTAVAPPSAVDLPVPAPTAASPLTPHRVTPPPPADEDPRELEALGERDLIERANRGSPAAAFLLARRRLAEDPNDRTGDSLEWLRTAGERGHAEAQYQLGLDYSAGMICAKDEAEASRWYELAAANGVVGAQYEIGLRYLGGRGVAKDALNGARWLMTAAQQGAVNAQVELGLKFALGEGAARDAGEAVRWFREAADAGSAKGRYYLGFAYLKGLGVERDAAAAKRWLELSARQGNSHAMRQLGEMYEKSLGVGYSLQEAYKWYYLAEQEGDEKAAKRLDVIARHLPVTGVSAARRKAGEWLTEVD